MRRAEERVVDALSGQVDVPGALEARALREVVRPAEAILGGNRRENAVHEREVDEARVGVADRQGVGRAVRLAARVEPAEERRVRGAVLEETALPGVKPPNAGACQ